MIITISGADFSASNIGTLSTWTVSKSIGAGAEHSIPSYVDKNSAFNYTITLKDGYTFGTYSVTMGGQTITPTVTETSITINIASVTGAIRIEVKTINSSTGEEEEPGTGGDSGSTTYYTLTHGNDYNATYMDDKRRASIQPYTIVIPSGVTIKPKSGYQWAHMTGVDPNNMPSGSGPSWNTNTYTGTGIAIGITFKKDSDGEFDWNTDSIYASDYFDVSDSSIWIVGNNTPSEPSEPSEPSGENTDLSTLTLQFGNPFGTTEQQTDNTRANSVKNAYLTEGTTITLKDNVTYKWALKKVTTETGQTIDSSFNSGNYVPDSVWSSKKSYTIVKSGYYRIVLLKADNSAFDWSTDSNNVSTYFELS